LCFWSYLLLVCRFVWIRRKVIWISASEWNNNGTLTTITRQTPSSFSYIKSTFNSWWRKYLKTAFNSLLFIHNMTMKFQIIFLYFKRIYRSNIDKWALRGCLKWRIKYKPIFNTTITFIRWTSWPKIEFYTWSRIFYKYIFHAFHQIIHSFCTDVKNFIIKTFRNWHTTHWKSPTIRSRRTSTSCIEY